MDVFLRVARLVPDEMSRVGRPFRAQRGRTHLEVDLVRARLMSAAYVAAHNSVAVRICDADDLRKMQDLPFGVSEIRADVPVREAFLVYLALSGAAKTVRTIRTSKVLAGGAEKHDTAKLLHMLLSERLAVFPKLRAWTLCENDPKLIQQQMRTVFMSRVRCSLIR